jgi:cytolysin (calcineurin-like family phosphatase)
MHAAWEAASICNAKPEARPTTTCCVLSRRCQDVSDLFEPKAARLGGFELVCVPRSTMGVVFGEAPGDNGDVTFTHVFNKPLA